MSTDEDDAAKLAAEVARTAAADADSDDLPTVTPIVGHKDLTPESQKVITRIEVPFRTIIRVVLSIFVIWLLLQVWHIFLLVFVAFFLAMALLPLVLRLKQWGLPYVAAVGAVSLAVLVAIVGFFALIVPPMVNQIQSLVDNAGSYADRFQRILQRYPSIDQRVQELRDNPPNITGSSLPWGSVLSLSTGIAGAITNVTFVLILVIYLLLEGERTWLYVSRYFTPRLRFRLRRAFPDIIQVVSGYMRGQIITSALFGIFVFILLAATGVPQPILLAVLAAILDAVPIIGVPIATIPALLLAATVSIPTMLIVLAAYVIYQQFENYLLVPRVFGNALEVSSISILLGILIGGQLLGVLGTLLALPITAAIPVLERVWNEDVPAELGEDVEPAQV
ncbi:MAG: AI-2E family transporter [Thermomicrobiales bacterium]